MARIDRVRESYEQITERLFSDKTAFEQYLKFAGKFFKVSSEQSMTIYGTNPNATMVADFDTWKKFSRRVKRGTNSIAVLDNGSLKHYFDISQTAGSSIPYQWTLDKETANAIIAETFENEGKHFSSFSGCVNYLGSEKAHESLDSVVRSLNISAENRTAFEKSYISMVQYLIAARCELGGSFKYNGNVDLTALDMLHSKAEKEKLCEFVQLTGKSVLLSMEKSIHNIELQRRTIDNGRNQADLVRPDRLVRGGQDVLSRNQGGERQTVQAGQGNVRVSGTDGTRSDGRGTGADERADRSLGNGVAEVYDGKSPRSNSVPERSAEMGADTPTDRQGGLGVSDAPAETVREGKSPSDNVRGNSEMGEHSRYDNRQGDSGGHSTSVSGVSDNNGATYSTENNEQTAEENSPAVSVSADSSDLLSALRQHREIFFEDEPEQMIANANSGRATNLRVAFDEDLGKFILRGDYHRNVEVIESAWLSDKSTAEEMEQLIKQNGYKIRGYGDLTEEKSPETQAESKAAETPKRERSESEAADLRYIEDKTREYLRSVGDKSALYPYILAEMDENSALAETAYSKAFAYCYEEKIMLKDVPDEDLTEIITAVVEERANELWENIPLDTLKDIDKFYVNEENESVIWAYFNPDSSAGRSCPQGGQLVYHTFTYDQLFEAIVKNEPMDYLEQVSKTELVDVTEPNFQSAARDFLEDNESFSSRDEDLGAKLSALVEPRYGIFQLKNGENLRDYRFVSADSLKKDGLYVDRENYDRVYRGRLREGETLEDIYQRFNINRPEDFYGHSLSVSDVICIKSNGTTAAYYVDSIGFTRVPDFTLSREERKARRTLTDNLTLLADNQLASDEMDTLGDKLFRYDETPKYKGSSNAWLIGAGMTADKFEDITTRYHNGEDVRAELAKGMYDNMTHIEFYEFPPADGIRLVDISTEKTESGMTFRTKGGFEITHSWETLGDALITAARQEFDRHEELDRRYREQEEKAKAAEAPYVTVKPFSNVDFAKIGLDSEKHYTIPEFNEALANADKLYTADDNNSLRVDTFSVTLHIGEKNYQYRPMLGAEYGTLSAIMDDSSLVNSSNISITTQEKELVAEIEVEDYERKAAENSRENSVTAYRVGDFYEFFAEDAKTTSDLLNLTLTKRQDVPMTGVPLHAFEDYKAKLAAQGYEVKIGDEREINNILNTNSQPEKSNTSKSIDELRVGDLVRSDGAIWRITSIDGDFSINFENTNKTSIMPEQSIFGHWKQQFSKMGFEIVPPAELTVEQLRETNDTAPKPKKERTEAAQEEYGEQLNLFGEPMHEDEAPEKRILGGVDIEEALKYELIHYGTGFQDGKFRVEQFYREHGNDTTEFAKFLAKEYGTGGHSCEGNVSMSWHDSKGIKLDFKLDNDEKTSVTWSWQKIASRLATLIENQTYITQKDIDDRIRNAQYYVGHYDIDDIQYQRGMKVLEEYGLLDNAREEQAPDRAAETDQKETVSHSPEKSEAAEPTAEITEIKNLVQLKRALVVGTEFEITSAFRPEVANQLRRVNYADTTGIYSIRPDAPDDRVTLANNGRGSYIAWGKSADWSFKNGSYTAYQKGSEHIPDNVVFTLKVKPRVIEKELTEEHQQAPEQQEKTENNLLAVGKELTYEDRQYRIDSITDSEVKFLDLTMLQQTGMPIFRAEPLDYAKTMVESAEHERTKETPAPKLNNIVIDLTPRPEREEIPVEKNDYTITNENLGVGGAKTKFAANITAIRTLKTIEAENRLATSEEQAVLAQYVGWGGIAQAFDENNAQWANEFKQLRELLTDEEYSAAKGSVLNAHYTTPTVINAIYKGLENLGFEGGNILEPAMGVGNFFGVMPEEMRQNSHLHGVELDSISGRIARQLYQTADIQIKGFEKTEFSDNFFDAAVGNVPFGSYGVSDKRYNRENFFIHDYFLAKTLDKLAPGGVAALITTKGTLDKENPKVREYLARRGDLIGAIRLPNTAFKANAGTEVTTDILFFQKREKMAVEMPDWCYVGKNSEGVPVNSYFLDHPEMILGEMKQGMEYSLYGNATETACVPIEGADLKEQLEAAVATLKLNNALRKHTEQREKEAGIISATEDVRNFTFAEVDGKMYFRENNIMTEVTETGKRLDRIKALNELRSTFRGLLSAQEENCSDEQLAALQAKLNTQYDCFVKEYGYINDSANGQIFGKDDDYNSLCALEIIDEEKKTIEKSDFFTKRTVKYTAEITHVDTPQEAMQVSIDTRGKMDIPYMAQLCGQEPQQVIDVLKADNLIYLNPLKTSEDNPLDGWEETSEYLSGNVREKLRTAELYAKDNPEYQRNVAALTSVIPPKLEAGDISARIGVSWVDVEDYQKFIEEYAKSRFFEPMRRTVTGEYKIENKNWDTSASAIQIYGTSRMPAKAIFENLLNNRDIVVRDKITDPDGREHYEINKKETDLAQEKARQMKEAFKRWLWDDPARREKYVERYNNLFNCIVGRKFDGSHQTFPGMSPSISLKPHQLDAVMRAKFGGNTLLAHCVGAGKSFEMVAATMEKKRLGLINKACVVVPKHLVGQMANEWLRLYPQAKILTATEKDFDKNHRQKFIGRCCTGDYDAVIMSYEQFEKIPMSMEYRQNFIQREIDTMQSGIDELSGDYRSRTNNRSSIKDLEREKKRLEARLQKLIDGGGKTKDTSLTFEQLGFDSLVVDEAHNYKNGLVVSKMNRVSGVQTTPAQKSEDILMKTQFLNENYGEKNIIFATGTPVSNSMTELYIMQRYLRPSLLENAGLQTFDDWASNFGEVVSKAELKPAGNGYRTKKRFAKFNNVPELMQMYKEFADIRTADMLDLPVPEIEGGKPQTIVAKPNDVQNAYMQVLADRSEAIHSGAVDQSVDNMLKITNEARLLGLDARCIVQNAENYPDSKVNLCIDKVMEIYQQTAEQKGVQAIFCDIAVNSDDGKFSVYDYIKEELVRRGIPESEICKAGDAETQKQRNEMYAQLRSGTKRIVLASTSKMGTGANIQTKLAALHNLDIPWKPSDIEQRNGRIIRQGNEFGKVGVYNYVTENTFDAYLMNIIVTKQRFISQLMNGNATARSCEDVDEAVLNYSEMQALASGDERIKEKIELDGDVARLRLLENEHYNSQYRLDDTIKNAERWIDIYSDGIKDVKTDIEFAAEHKPQSDEFKVEIGGKVYTERKAAGEAIQKAAIKFMAEVGGEQCKPIGTFCGFQLAIEKIHNGFTVGAGISLRNKLTYTTEMDITGDIGNVTRLENLFNKGFDKKLSEVEDKVVRLKTDLQEAQAAKGKPFEHAEELAQKSARLEQLNRELEVGKAEEVIMNESEDEVQGNESHGSHEQDKPDNNRPTPPKHKR